MITEDYVSFEVAKLLKEKGFNEEIETLISPDGKIYHCDERSVFKIPHKTIKNSDINIYIDDCSCPTIQMTMKWLREVHNIFIDIYTLSPLVYIYRVCLISDTTGYLYEDYACEEGERFMSYKEAVEFALDYCLNNILEV